MIKRLELLGSPKEIGMMHGTKGKKEVLNSLQTYEKFFYENKFIKWENAREQALTFLKEIEKYDSEILEEMEGIAIGAGVQFEDILALNVRSELALTNPEQPRLSDGCTVIGLTQPASLNTIIAQNWDWIPPQKNNMLLLEIHSKEKPDIIMITEAGIIGKIGFNSSGIGVCFNALVTDKRASTIPVHVGLRGILNSYNLTEAVTKIKDHPLASSANFLIGYDDGIGNGLVIDIEASPFGIDYIDGTKGTFVHTNHICSKRILQSIRDMNNLKYNDSVLRKIRIEQLMNTSLANKEEINEETVQRWLSDTFNAPNSINYYSNDYLPKPARIETIFSIVINLSNRKAYYRLGNNPHQEYVEI